MWDPYAEFQSATLPNGLTVYAAHWPERQWEAMGFLIHSGAERDPIGFEGLAHFVEHLVSKNANVPQKEMRAFFGDCGGKVDFGATGYPRTYYRFFVPIDKNVLFKAFSMFGHMLFSAKLEKFIERERQVIIGEFHQNYKVKFELDLDIREHKALYSGYCLERFVCPIGNPESVKRITQSELQSYYDTHYTPANMSIVGVGGLTLSELVKFLSESPFAVDKKGIRTPLPLPAIDFSPPLETRYVFEVSKCVADQIETGAYRSVAKIPGNINMQVVRIMKEMFNEIINEEVREKRAWTYSINSSYGYFRHFYEFSINCKAFALEAINDIEEVVEVCIASVRDREDLFKQIKGHILASNFMIDSTGRSICDNVLDNIANYQRIISLAEIGRNLESVTMEDICNLLQYLRPERRWTLIAKP